MIFSNILGSDYQAVRTIDTPSTCSELTSVLPENAIYINTYRTFRIRTYHTATAAGSKYG